MPTARQRAPTEGEAGGKAATEVGRAKERGGGDGREPVRYGDWEKKGIAVDF